MMDTKTFLSVISVILWGGFFLAAMGKSRKLATLSLWLALAGSAFSAIFGGMFWLGALPLPNSITSPNLWAGTGQGLANAALPPLQLEFQLDALSAFFVFLVSFFSAIVAIYSFGALNAPHYERHRSRIIAAFNLFIWSMLLVVFSYDIFSLLLSLEFSSLVLAYLALYKHQFLQSQPTSDASHQEQKKARIAPQVYLALSHVSVVLLLIALLILAIQNGGMSYSDLYKQELSPFVPTLVFLLALAGLGIRAGLTPAHIWPPLVHPSAPITLHTLFTGVGIKIAVYLMYRFFFQFLKPQHEWGYLLLAVSVLTALVNVWYAISSHDLKTALAYHSVENIGIICVGIGIGLIFWNTAPAIAYLGLIASLYHVLNHAFFKGLLFLATGAIDNLTHQVMEMDKLGGLLKRYGFTSTMFLIGALAIAGFPPLNGFMSEWLTLQALLGGIVALSTSPLGLSLLLPGLVFLTASFALTAFCFYKIVGIAFLGLPRSPKEMTETWETRDAPLSMKSMMALLASGCLALGLLPLQTIGLLGKALAPLGVNTSKILQTSTNGIDITLRFGVLSNSLPVLGILGLVSVLLVIAFFISSRAKIQKPASAWNGGSQAQEPPIHQFSGAAASFLLHDTFTLPVLDEQLRQVPEYLPAHIQVSPSVRSPGRSEIFSALTNFWLHKILLTSQSFGDWTQNRDIRRYLWYIFAVNLLTLLIFILVNIGGK